MRAFLTKKEEWDLMFPSTYRRLYKTPVDLRHLILGRSREEYIAIMHRMGIKDVCECGEFSKQTTRRPNSGDPGQLECIECHLLTYPHMSIYPCDECTEPVLSEINWIPIKMDFLCDECSV